MLRLCTCSLLALLALVAPGGASAGDGHGTHGHRKARARLAAMQAQLRTDGAAEAGALDRVVASLADDPSADPAAVQRLSELEQQLTTSLHRLGADAAALAKALAADDAKAATAARRDALDDLSTLRTQGTVIEDVFKRLGQPLPAPARVQHKMFNAWDQYIRG